MYPGSPGMKSGNEYNLGKKIWKWYDAIRLSKKLCTFLGLPPLSPGVLPVSVPYNPTSKDNTNNAGPSLIIPSGVLSGQSVSQPQGSSETDSKKHSAPSSTTSTPTNVIPGPPSTVSSSSEPQSSASSTSVSPSTAQPPKIFRTEDNSKDETDKTFEGSSGDNGDKIEPYVDFREFYRLSSENGEDGAFEWRSS